MVRKLPFLFDEETMYWNRRDIMLAHSSDFNEHFCFNTDFGVCLLGGVVCLRDIENVPIPAHVSPLDCLSRLRTWLRGLQLDGPGVDLRISVIYCPGKVF